MLFGDKTQMHRASKTGASARLVRRYPHPLLSFAVAIICGYVVFYFASTLFCHRVIVTSLFGVESCLNHFFYDSFKV